MARPIIAIRYLENSNWKSCRSIISNLAKTYRLAFGSSYQEIFISRNRMSWEKEVTRVVDSTFRANPHRIVFFDDFYPHPDPIITKLDQAFGRKLPPLFFHTFGNFTYNSASWISTESRLKGRRIKFICSSDRHTKLIRSLLKSQTQSVAKFLFPIDSKMFYFSPQIRHRARRQFSIADQEVALVYSGRLTWQKNIMNLLNTIVKLNGKFRLFLAGQFDELGGPFDGGAPVPGLYFSEIQSCLRNLPKDVQSRIHFLGSLDQNKLHELYNAADIFVSLSTFHDEDFGMAPCEALSCGCKAVLTDWGGFGNFNVKHRTSHIPVQVTGAGHFFDLNLVAHAIEMAGSNRDPESERQRGSNNFLKKFDIPYAAVELKSILKKDPPAFRGFSESLKEFGEKMTANQIAGTPIFPDGFGPRSFYQKVFHPYWSPI